MVRNGTGTEDDPIQLEMEPDTVEEGDEQRDDRMAATRHCFGTISATMKDRCSTSQCATLVGKRHRYPCDDDCPIKANTWYRIPHRCTPGGIKWLSGCIVQYNNITPCQ